MSQSLVAAFVVFGAVMAFTPGPNNIMVLSSGLTYGFRRSLPHISGIAIGVSLMVASVGLGLGAVFLAYPVLQTILKYVGIAYWLWGRLLRDHTAAQVVPFALLVPFVGAAASSVVFGETFGPLRLAGMVTVVGGIAVMLLSKRAAVVPKIA